MKILSISFFLFFCGFSYSFAQDQGLKNVSQNPVYDSILAQKYGADDYGMRTYYFAYLKAGPNRSQSKEEAAQLQRAHMDNIGRLANEGKLIVAGPFMDNGEVRGIYIFCVATLEEAQSLAETDPAVKAGRLILEMHPWYGSAALMAVPELHKKLGKKEI